MVRCEFDPREGPDGLTSGVCETHAEKVRLLDELATIDSEHPEVRRIAGGFVDRSFAVLVSGDARAGSLVNLARELHAFAQSMTFREDDEETFVSTLRNIAHPVGDCDDSTRVLLALARAAGLRARLATLEDADGIPVHAVAQLDFGNGWTWAETSIPARFGEHPLDAKARLGLGRRTDIRDPRAVRGLGDVAGSYEAQALAVVSEAAADPDFMGAAAPAVRVGVQVYGIADEAAALVTSSPDARAAAALELAKQVAGAIATAAGMAELIPVVGAIVGAFAADPATPGAAQSQAYCEQKARVYASVLPSGANGAVRPADYFRRPVDPGNDSNPTPTDPEAVARGDGLTVFGGALLFACSASDPWGLDPRIGVFQGGVVGNLSMVRGSLAQPNLGLTTAQADRLGRLIAAVGAGYRTSDGGAAPWAVLADTLRILFARGQLSREFIRYLICYRSILYEGGRLGGTGNRPAPGAGGQVNAHIQAMRAALGADFSGMPQNNCWRWWGASAADQVAALVSGWQNTVFPAYALDAAKAAEVEAKALQLARAAVGPKLRPSLSNVLAQTKTGKLSLSPESVASLRTEIGKLPRFSAPAKVVGGAGLLAAAWYGAKVLRWL